MFERSGTRSNHERRAPQASHCERGRDDSRKPKRSVRTFTKLPTIRPKRNAHVAKRTSIIKVSHNKNAPRAGSVF